MAVQRLTPVLDDHVDVRLEDRNDLLGRWHGLALEHAATRLVDHVTGSRDVVLHRLDEVVYLLLLLLRRLPCTQLLQGGHRVKHSLRRLLRHLDQIAVQWLAVLGRPRALDLQHASLGSPAVVLELALHPPARAAQQPYHDANAIIQQRRVAR
ncbi:hypothetical protein WMF16_05765 [Sorangium sp. So ce388]